MPKYEYTTINNDGFGSKAAMDDFLNEYGQKGWRLVNMQKKQGVMYEGQGGGPIGTYTSFYWTFCREVADDPR